MKPRTVQKVLPFFKRTYKVVVVAILAVLFFLGYNTYLVDRSLVNLKKTLESVSNVQSPDDVRNLVSSLDYALLAELSSEQVDSSNIVRLELAKNILSKATDSTQLEDAKFALRQVIKQKESQRPGILSTLDKINTFFNPASAPSPSVDMANEVQLMEEKVKKLANKEDLQEAYYKLGNICSVLSDFDKAKEAYEKALVYAPSSELSDRIKFNIAWNERRRGNFEAAIAGFEQIARSASKENLITLSWYQIAEIYRVKGDYKKAISIYQNISKGNKESILAQLSELQIANTFLYDLKDPVRAREIFKQTEETFQGTDIAEYIKINAIPKIISQYRSEGFLLLDEAKRFEQVEKYKEAIRYFDKALEISPQDSESYAGKAVVYLWMNDPDTALQFARKAVQLAPDNEAAITNLGYIYIQMGITSEAITEYKRFLTANPFSAHCYYNLGYAYAIEMRTSEAADAFKNAIRINSRFSSAYNNLGWCLWKESKYSEALTAFERAGQLQPKYVDAIYNLGEVYRVLGRYDEARKQYQTVAKIDPANVRAQDRLALLDKVTRKKETQAAPAEKN